jgi:hypothetical protein
MEINPVSTTDQIKFNWTKSKPATGGPAVTYRVLFAERKLFVCIVQSRLQQFAT